MRVLVWLSWWVDSAVAAYLLKQQGFDVVGGFMKNYVSEIWNCTTYDDAQEAIKVAKARAQKNDIVLLSTACASFGMFKNYKERGELFKEAVKNLWSSNLNTRLPASRFTITVSTLRV